MILQPSLSLPPLPLYKASRLCFDSLPAFSSTLSFFPKALHFFHPKPIPIAYRLARLWLELANSQETLEDSDSSNQRVVLALYAALSSHDVATVHRIVAADLEWWFHGPPSHQFLMRLLTGTATDSATSFRFVPQSITSFGPTVLVEGCDHARSIAWVHAWTVTDGIITQVREYLNTSLTVTRLGNSHTSSPPSDFSTPSSSSSTSEITSLHCPSLWESSVSSRVGKSVPGLVLAI
ncbi:Wound-induced protein 1 [Morella rubra]|uniref:Wound-induced protein 1 n=1 Tax=Morella rubra TaxID=262757 RepID=A0A6A1VMJ2_9ROSI|nr:Wound-induced protein 1 [Morella rubra]